MLFYGIHFLLLLCLQFSDKLSFSYQDSLGNAGVIGLHSSDLMY